MNYNINSGYGLAESIRLSLSLPTMGRLLVVCPSTDANYDRLSQLVINDPEGNVRLFTSLASAYDAAITNANDVIALSANAAHVLTSMLTISKNRIHFVGLGGPARKYGQRTRVTMGITTATTDVHMIKNIGVGNTFTNIKFDSGNTLTQATSTIGEGGEYAIYTNCEFYNSVKLTSDTHAEVLLNGDSTQFYNCTFGSLADSVTGDKVRPAVITTGGGVAGGAGVSRDITFSGCNFWKNAGGTTTAMIKITADNDLERLMLIEDCVFAANKLGSTPAVAIASATLSKAQVLLTGSTVSANCTKLATATGIISGLPVRVATLTVGVQAS